MSDYDLIVVGAGPSGYVAAIRAAQLGMNVVILEKNEIGGVCLNWGCIPSKALLRNAEVLSLFRRADEFGIEVENVKADYAKAVERSRHIVSRLTRGISSLLRKNKVDVLSSEARLVSSDKVAFNSGSDTITAPRIILATGARPRLIPGLLVDGERVVTSREAIEQRDVPAHIVIVGGGSIAVEFATIYSSYGAQVTVVEMLSRLVPNEDEEISVQLKKTLTGRGISVLTGSTVKGFVAADNSYVKISDGNSVFELPCDRLLIAVGIEPNIDGLGLDEVGVGLDRGFVAVDNNMATTVPSIYAIGDLTGKLPLAHVGMAQGVVAVERMAGLDVPDLNYVDMPRATYSAPQISSFGLTEQQARDQGFELKVGRFPFRGNGKALALGDYEGMVKIVSNANGDAVLGVHMIGAEVTELLGEASLIRLLQGSTEELAWLVHPHPSLSEAIKEAALAVEGRAIHM
jgi:dihydrolipoamide dehydrogenase